MPRQILVTGYTNPDLDAAACAVAYAELLCGDGQSAVAAVFGVLHQEAAYVLTRFAVPEPVNGSDALPGCDAVVLVDASERRGIAAEIKTEQVVEIIDHRQMHEVAAFPNAKAQIELVGAAATLVAERFAVEEKPITPASAALLYAAIISNTVNFKANVTTARDRTMAAWLLERFELPPGFIRDMFAAKSVFTRPIREVMEGDCMVARLGSAEVAIIQLEILNLAAFLQNRHDEVEAVLATLQRERKVDYIFLTAIDLDEGTNTFVTIDAQTRELLTEALGVTFTDGVAVREGVTMRKTIGPLIKQVLEQRQG